MRTGTVEPLIVDCATITTMDFHSVKLHHKHIFLCNRGAIYILLTKMCFSLQLYGKPSLSKLIPNFQVQNRRNSI